MQAIVKAAIDELCSAFERGGYNPTPIIDIGVLVASANGRVDDREMLQDVFQALLKTSLTPEVVDHLIAASLEVIEVAGAQSRARLVAAILQDCDAVEPGTRVALTVAFASHGLSQAEMAVVERIALPGGMTAARLKELTDEMQRHADPDPISVRHALAPPQSR